MGSRLRRRCEAPQTPLRRLAVSGAADPVRVTELQRLREGLDPFDLSATIEAKRQGIFALSREAPASGRASCPESAMTTVVALLPAVARPAEGQLVDMGRQVDLGEKTKSSSPASRKNEKPSAVEMTRRRLRVTFLI